MPTDYAETLYALGAVPIGTAVRGFRSDETSQAVYMKGERVDVNGWLSPYWAKRGEFLTDTDRERYDARRRSFTDEEYAALLNADQYRQTKDPQLYAVMAFVLESMLQEGTSIRNLDKVIGVYEADVDLDERVFPLLQGGLSSDKAMRLYEMREDARVLDVSPVPRPDETKYVQFLQTMAEGEPTRGWTALRLLYGMDRAGYQERFRDLTVRRIREMDRWQDRLPMYRTLVEIGDGVSMQVLVAGLFSDPVTEAREAIVLEALARNVCAKELVDSVVQLAEGQGENHASVTPSRMSDQWRHNLRKYLVWTKDYELCDATSQAKARDALEVLDRQR